MNNIIYENLLSCCICNALEQLYKVTIQTKRNTYTKTVCILCLEEAKRGEINLIEYKAN